MTADTPPSATEDAEPRPLSPDERDDLLARAHENQSAGLLNMTVLCKVVKRMVRLLDARDARIAVLEQELSDLKADNRSALEEMDRRGEQIDDVTAALAQAEAALQAALGYMTNAMVDLETGAPKRTALATIKGGMSVVRAALPAALAAPASPERTTDV